MTFKQKVVIAFRSLTVFETVKIELLNFLKLPSKTARIIQRIHRQFLKL